MQEIEQVYRKHYDHFVSVVRRKGVSYHHAEEIVQDAFVRLLELAQRSELDGEDLFRYITMSLNDITTKHQLQETNKGMTGTQDTVDEDELRLFYNVQIRSPEETFGDWELLREIYKKIKQKPNHVEKVLLMHFMHGMDQDRIERETGKALQTVYNIIYRFRKELTNDEDKETLHHRSFIQFSYNPNDWPVIKKD